MAKRFINKASSYSALEYEVYAPAVTKVTGPDKITACCEESVFKVEEWTGNPTLREKLETRWCVITENGTLLLRDHQDVAVIADALPGAEPKPPKVSLELKIMVGSLLWRLPANTKLKIWAYCTHREVDGAYVETTFEGGFAIYLHYHDRHDRPVRGAKYYVRLDDSTVREGTLDDNGYACLSFPNKAAQEFEYYFHDDPRPFELFRQPIEHGLQALGTGLEAVGAWFADTGIWLWGAVQGDFNEDPTIGQIVFNVVVGLIPIADQVLDVRDIVANLKLLIWDGRVDDVWVWLALVLTIIGCIPEVGSVIKGVFKVIFKFLGEVGSKVTPKQLQQLIDWLIRVLNTVGEGNAYRWLKKLHGQLGTHQKFVVDKIESILDELLQSFKKLNRYVPESMSGNLAALIKSVEKARMSVRKMVSDIFAKVKDMLEKALGSNEHFVKRGEPGRNVRTQEAGIEWASKIDYVSDHFPTAHLALNTVDPTVIAQISKYANWQAKQARVLSEALVKVDFGTMNKDECIKAVDDIYEQIVEMRYQKAIEDGKPRKEVDKIKLKILDNDPNNDAFGAMSKLVAGSKAYEQRHIIGQLIRGRFQDINGDIVQTKIRLTNGKVITGNTLHRRAAAEKIYLSKVNKETNLPKYEYGPLDEKFITGTATAANQQILHNEAVQIFSYRVAQRDRLGQDLALLEAYQREYAYALYCLFHGPIYNRGSDTVIRLFGTTMFGRIFGKPIILPQDVDVRAYAMTQEQFVDWFLKAAAWPP